MIRPATAADAKAIAEIWNPLIRDSEITFTSTEKTPEDIAELIADRHAAGFPFLVAEENEQIQGFASYAQFRGGIGYARTMEHTVILAPGAQGKGLGRDLLQALEAHARASGVHSMIAGVSNANPAAIAFHEALGYTLAATLPEVGHKFGKAYDLLLLQKRL